MDLNTNEEKMKEIVANNAKNQEVVEAGLKDKKHVLLHSNPGMGRTTLAKKAAENVGLSVVEFDTVGHEFNSESDSKEKVIISRLHSLEGNAILVNMIAGENIDAFINAANLTKLPLIVSLSHNRPFEPTLEIKLFDKAEEMKNVLDTIKPLNTQDFNPKIPTPSASVLERMRVSFASDLDDSNKPKPK